MKPGRVVGEALDFLLEARLDEGPISEAEAYARLDAWAATSRGVTRVRARRAEPSRSQVLRAVARSTTD